MVLKFGIPGKWGSLTPALQHTMYADAILINQFESLTKIQKGGIITSGCAVSWKVNENFTIYDFKIDTTKQFSNGKFLEASDFKKAWEYGLKLTPKSSNSSLKDVLHKLVGFEEFIQGKENHLKGVDVLDKENLRLVFASPFRTGLGRLASGRTAVFLMEKDKALGTGPYVEVNHSEEFVKFEKNPFYKGELPFNSVEVNYIPKEEALKVLREEKIDVLLTAEAAIAYDEIKKDEPLEFFMGMESLHSIAYINGMKNRFFSNPRYRRALQYLLTNEKVQSYFFPHLKSNLKRDNQIFLKLQQGRIPDEEVKKIIDAGGEYVHELIEATKNNPILVVNVTSGLLEYLRATGLKISEKSGPADFNNFFKVYYQTFEPDVMFGGFSIVSGDPDSVYHALSKNGAITSPMIYRKKVSDLLEEGRDLVDPNQIDSHYQKVTRAVLEEVPIVHFGFLSISTVYNSKKLKMAKEFKGRKDNEFSLYLPK